MEELLGLLGIGGGGLLVGNAYNSLGNVGDTAWDRSQNIGQQAYDNTMFQGYGVTGPYGSASVDSGGNTSMMLSPEQQAMADQYRNAASGAMSWNNPLFQYGTNSLNTAQSLLGGVGQDPSAREGDIYQRIRAMQQPEEQRQQLALESRLAAQGRSGVSTAAYGATPEQLTLQKAIQEGQNSASVEAIRLAQQQQMQDAQAAGMLSQSGAGAFGTQGDLARMYGTMQYLPGNALLNQFQAGSQGASFEDIARRQAANAQAESQMGGLEALLGSRLGQANLMGQLGSSALTGGFGMLSSALAGNGGSSGILNNLFTKISGWF